MPDDHAPDDLKSIPENDPISQPQNVNQSKDSKDFGSEAPQQQANSHFLESDVSEGRQSDHNSTISSSFNLGKNNLTFGVQSNIKRKIKLPTSLVQLESQSKRQIPIIREEKDQICKQ